MPFYDQPGSHLSNVALGAGIGALAGLGVYLHGKWFGSSRDSDDYASNGSPTIHAFVSASQPALMWKPTQKLLPETRTWMPLVSLNW